MRVRLALDKNCWVCRKLLLHSTVTGLASSSFPFRARFEAVTVECSNHFLHTEQFFIQSQTHPANDSQPRSVLGSDLGGNRRESRDYQDRSSVTVVAQP